MAAPADNAGKKKGALDVVVMYAFDCTTSTPDWNRVNEVYWLVQEKLANFPGSCLSYLYVWTASNRYTTEKRMVGVKNILPESTVGCTKNMASGLPEAHRLIGLSSDNPNGIILLFSDGSPNNKGDFFDKAEDYVSTVPVHTFTLGSDAYNQGLCTMAANSPGGSFNSVPIPDKRDPASPLSLLLDGILSGKIDDDDKPPTSNSGNSTTKNLVTIEQSKYFKEDASLEEDTVTVEVEIKATKSTAVREGLDLVAVLDVSSRMANGKIDNMKNAIKFVIMKLTPVDRLSIVIFSDGAARINPLRSMTPDAQKELIALVDRLSARGGTNIRAGLETALAVIAGRANTAARTPNIFLLTDGKQTVDDAKKVDPGQVGVYTFGFGSDSDHDLLSELAAKSPDGMFSTVPDGANLTAPFAQQVGGLLTVVAQDVQLLLRPKTDKDPDGGDLKTLVVAPGTDYSQTTDAAGVITIKFGNLFAEESRKVIITLDLVKSTLDYEYDAALAEAVPNFSAQGKEHKNQRPDDIQIRRTPTPSQLPGASDKSRQLQAEMARRAVAAAIKQARLLADGGDLDEARYTLVDAQNALEDVMLNDGQKLVNALRAELVQLIRLMDSKSVYESKGRAYALASEVSHGRQRYAARGHDDDDVRLFSTPRMDSYLDQAKTFDKDPTAPVQSADEDVKQEVAANPLAAISNDLIVNLRNAIQALQAMQKIVVAKA